MNHQSQLRVPPTPAIASGVPPRASGNFRPELIERRRLAGARRADDHVPGQIVQDVAALSLGPAQGRERVAHLLLQDTRVALGLARGRDGLLDLGARLPAAADVEIDEEGGHGDDEDDDREAHPELVEGAHVADRDLTRRQRGLAMALASKNLLLVLDNCEHLADDIAPLIDLLRARAPNVRLLTTSQESLKCSDVQVYRLGALAVPPSAQLEEATDFGAVALFVERAHAVESRFRLASDNVEVVIDICRRLDWHSASH